MKTKEDITDVTTDQLLKTMEIIQKSANKTPGKSREKLSECLIKIATVITNRGRLANIATLLTLQVPAKTNFHNLKN